ncbi:MAG: AIPR family protein [Candidatus Marsarchaeota archaeon]|nr:AIPR family protein [Candidatus Marsarchaeota archaeon]
MEQASKLTLPDIAFSKVVQEKVDAYAMEWKHGDKGDAFAQWVTELILEVPEDIAFNASYVGSVGHDHGLDSIVRLDQTLYLIQAKGTEDCTPNAFPESVIDDFLRCLEWLENPTLRTETSGYDFQRASQVYKQAVEDGCKIRLILVLLGSLSPDAESRFQVEQSKMITKRGDYALEKRTFQDLKEEYVGSLELEEDFKDSLLLKVEPDQTFEKTANGLKAFVVTVPATELRRIYVQYGRRLFFYNVRFYLQKTGVNKAIMGTLKVDNKYKSVFWHLNNGIVIVCKSAAWTDREKRELRLEAPQIVNGCQTVVTLANADNEEYGLEDVDVLARIIETDDREFGLKITQATNTQNVNSARDLASNEPEQVRLQGLFSQLDPPFYYERKRREFESLEQASKSPYIDPSTRKPRLVENSDVASAYLSFACQMPTQARTKFRELFDVNTGTDERTPYYDLIFKGERTAEEYLLPTLLAEKIWLYLRDFRKRRNQFEQIVKRKLRVGEKLTTEEENQVQEFRTMEALPYARTQILGLTYLLITEKYSRFNSVIARGLMKYWYEKPKIFQDIIDYAVYTIISHTNSARTRDPAIDFDNAYKLENTYRELSQELKRRLADKFLKSPLDELPEIVG